MDTVTTQPATPDVVRPDDPGLIYFREPTLANLTLALGVVLWIALIVGTFGVALVGVAAGFVIYLFTQSALIAYIKGNGVELSESQFPDLYAHYAVCCDRLQIRERPAAYVLNGNGGLNAFATRFLGAQYVVLLSDVVDAMGPDGDGIRFYLGHELGHLRMKHLTRTLFCWPALWIPLLGAAYSRARESTCDRHGLACSSPVEAARALAALAAGSERWKQLSLDALVRQTSHTSEFWMSFHELTTAYPWLSKRVARMLRPEADLPKRHGLAYVPAAFIPFAGRLGGGFGFLILVYVCFILGAIAVPQFLTYQGQSKLHAAMTRSQPARDALAVYYEAKEEVPADLGTVHVSPQLDDTTSLSLDTDTMDLTVQTEVGALTFHPTVTGERKIEWQCVQGKGTPTEMLPPGCVKAKGEAGD